MFLLLTCAPATWAPLAHLQEPGTTLQQQLLFHSWNCISNFFDQTKKIASTAIILVRQICPRHCLSQTTRSVIEDYLTSNEHSLSELATSLSVIDSLNQPDNVIVRSWNKLETSPKTDCIDKNFPTWTCSNLNWSNISTNLRTSHSVLF